MRKQQPTLRPYQQAAIDYLRNHPRKYVTVLVLSAERQQQTTKKQA